MARTGARPGPSQTQGDIVQDGDVGKDSGDHRRRLRAHQSKTKAGNENNFHQAKNKLCRDGIGTNAYQAKTKAGDEDDSGDEDDFHQAETKAELYQDGIGTDSYQAKPRRATRTTLVTRTTSIWPRPGPSSTGM